MPEPESKGVKSYSSSDHASSEVALAKPLDFRILSEPIALRPSKGAYGVPFDLVDMSQGSAMSEMLQQLQEADIALAAVNMVNNHTTAEA